MRIAILHPWFLVRGGSEKVVDVLADIFPEADIFTLLADETSLSASLRSRHIHTSLLQKLPFASKLYRHLVVLYPLLVESFDLREYDVILSSCGPAVIGPSVPEHAIHICYFHSPMRSWWDLYTDHQRKLPPGLREIWTFFASYLRVWEYSAAQRADGVIANSHYIARRIKKYLVRESTVIYPPVDLPPAIGDNVRGDYYLTVSRLEHPKRVDLLVAACTTLQRRLVVVGVGGEERRLRGIAGPTIEFRGHVSDTALADIYRHSRAFLFASREDFGLAPVEAQAFGKPVIAFQSGGVLETVSTGSVDGSDTGEFFVEQRTEDVIAAIERFEAREAQFDPRQIRANAERFSTQRFAMELRGYIHDLIQARA